MSASTAEIRRMVRVLKLAFGAGTPDEAVASLDTVSKQLARQGIDTSNEEDLIRIMTVGFHGKAPAGMDAYGHEFKRHSENVAKRKEFSREILRRHEGVDHTSVIRVLGLNRNCPEFTETEIKLVELLGRRRPMRINVDEWDVVETMLVKAGLSHYIPEYGQVDT